MKYYILLKNNLEVGVGEYAEKPKNDPIYKYKEITKEQYDIINKKEYTLKDN